MPSASRSGRAKASPRGGRRCGDSPGQPEAYGVLPACNCSTIASDFVTCASGVRCSSCEENTETILPCRSITKVVRGKKPCVTGSPFTSFTPLCGGLICRPYSAAILPPGSEATGNLPAQYLGSDEKRLSLAIESADTPMMVAPALSNLSFCEAKVCASRSQPPV